MTVLFLNKMGQKYNRQDWINESIHQVLMHIKYLCDNKTGLFYHGWTFNEMNNFGGIFWCRGNSWFTLGILDYVDMFKGTLNSGVKEIIIDAYKAQTAALKKLQSKRDYGSIQYLQIHLVMKRYLEVLQLQPVY